MKKIVLIALGCLIFFFTVSTSASACTKRPERQVLDLLLNLDIRGAETAMLSWPDSLVKDYYDAMIDVIKTYNGDNGVDEQMKKQAIDKLGRVIRKAERRYSTDDKENALVLAMARMYRAGLNVTRDKQTSAYNDTYESQQVVKALMVEYPDFADPLLVSGMMELFLSNIPEDKKQRAKSLLQLEGNRQKGLDLLERAIVSSPLTAPEAARVILMESGLEAPEICRYRSLASTLKNDYPANQLLELTDRIVTLKCNIHQAEGGAVASDQTFDINQGCL